MGHIVFFKVAVLIKYEQEPSGLKVSEMHKY